LPELPEVETVRRGLENRSVGFHIRKVEVLKERSIASPGGSKEFISKMQGVKIKSWSRRGKYLIASLEKDVIRNNKLSCNNSTPYGWWGVHLRMTGQFQWHKEKKKICPHTRVRFWNPQGHELRFIDTRNFGQMWWVPAERSLPEIISGLKKLGPEPFSEDFTTFYLIKKLKGKKSSIKSALLDQSIFAGTGNIYADESLFSAGIVPTKESWKLDESQIDNLRQSLINVLKISIGKGGTTFKDFRDLEGLDGNYGGEANVYRRTNKPCKKCGSIIQRTKIAGRSTHWCPKCQV
tara:strand:+ start:293 stop:1171 length:879 start_codon:yes stop_codon:yes gene_type:complete